MYYFLCKNQKVAIDNLLLSICYPGKFHHKLLFDIIIYYLMILFYNLKHKKYIIVVIAS